ncbi:MAG: glycosyltransferase family 4 protein [Saprospiraceae bacterium]|nr:glycosyltransferase family 4 protein [Saprospiraceae bacterium]
MRIAVFANSDWNLYNYRQALIKSLLQDGYQVVAMAPGSTYKKNIEDLGCSFVEVNNISRKSTNPLKDLRLIWELSQIYKSEKIDLVLCFTIKPNIYGAFGTLFSSTKVISTITGLGYSFLKGGPISFISNVLYKLAFKISDGVVFQNSDDLELFTNLGIVDINKTKLIRGSGIDVDYFQRSSKNVSNNFELLFVGRLLLDKGVLELLEAFSKVLQSDSEIVLTLVGGIDHGNPASIDEEIIAKYESENIRFVGHQANVKNYIEVSDAVILPSYREGLPRVLLEAMSMSKPIIATNVAGCREVVNHDSNGYLVESKNICSLEDAILKMINLDNVERLRMGEIGRELVELYFSDKVVTNGFLELMEEVG